MIKSFASSNCCIARSKWLLIELSPFLCSLVAYIPLADTITKNQYVIDAFQNKKFKRTKMKAEQL